jgi:hypothetical protein
MSIKDLFGKSSGHIATQKDLDELVSDVESVDYVRELNRERSRFVPRAIVDFDNPKTFAKFGSVQRYYSDAIKHIYNSFPYDGSLKEKLEWRNNSSYIDNYIFDNEYPRTTGYIFLNNPSVKTSSVFTGTASDPLATDWEYRKIAQTPQYVFFEGGMNAGKNPEGTAKKAFFNNSNIYDPEVMRESSLYAVGDLGNTIEFWWKRAPLEENITPGAECLFDMWNGAAVGEAEYGRILIEHWDEDWVAGNSFAKFTYYSKGVGVERADVGVTGELPDEFDPNEWNHYAFTAINQEDDLLVKFHINGQLITETLFASSSVDAIDWVAGNGMTARIGAYQTKPGTIELSGADFSNGQLGVMQGYVDEFRFWKKARTSKDIGRFWISQIGGGTNTDEANTELGIYYKFNEGDVGPGRQFNDVNSNVLDYSGRVTNAKIQNYIEGVRSVSSAIDEAKINNTEIKDPILYPFHQDVKAYITQKEKEGYEYDISNSGSLTSTLPAWVLEDELENGSGHIDNLFHIISTYFDTLHLQMEALPKLGNTEYVAEGQKPLPFIRQMLNSKGLVAPDIFIDATVFEALMNRAEDRVYEEDVARIKNTIYQNIFNNISGIYKTKGTEKSFRNLMRCFGIGDKIVKINQR